MERDAKKEFIKFREDKLNFNEIEKTFDRKLKTANKARENRRLFMDGIAWCCDGKKLEDATEMVTIDGTDVVKKDAVSFKRGFEEGAYQVGFKHGYYEKSYEEIPSHIAVIKNCKDGYIEGRSQKNRENKKTNQGMGR